MYPVYYIQIIIHTYFIPSFLTDPVLVFLLLIGPEILR